MSDAGGSDADPQRAYELLLRRVGEVYGQSQIVLDSSKTLSSLQWVQSFWPDPFDVLFLVRDVRGYVSSTRRFAAHRFGPLGRSALLRTAQWYVVNRKIERYLSRSRIRHLQVAYEEFCFRPEAVCDAIAHFLDLGSLSLDGLQNSDSHILQGNKMRYEPGRRDGIQYDHRWFHDTRSQLAAMVWPPLRRFNETHAYGNIERAVGRRRRG
jgi:hypothetical protein